MRLTAAMTRRRCNGLTAWTGETHKARREKGVEEGQDRDNTWIEGGPENCTGARRERKRRSRRSCSVGGDSPVTALGIGAEEHYGGLLQRSEREGGRLGFVVLYTKKMVKKDPNDSPIQSVQWVS